MRLSVITINLNNKEGLIRTASSMECLAGMDDVEWIVVDGASEDGSVEFVHSLGARVNRFVSESDKGIYHAMNKGAMLSSGEYLIFMNSGDRFVSDVMVNGLLQSLKDDIEYGDCLVETREGLRLESQPRKLSFQNFYSGCICHQATFVRREVQLRFPFDEEMRLASCRRFFMDAVVFGGVSINYLGIPIAIYDTGGVSAKYKDKLEREVEEFMPRYLPPLVMRDMHRLRQYDRIARNTPLYSLIERIHPYAGRRRIFEKLVILLSKCLFPK